MSGKRPKDTRTKTKKIIATTARALIKSVPVVGAGVDELIFGPLQDARIERIESMLEEVVDKAGSEAPGLHTEEMATLFESTTGQIARETLSDKRDRLRDLLTNAAAIPRGIRTAAARCLTVC